MSTQQKEKKKEVKIGLPLATYFEWYNQFLDSKVGKTLNLRKLSEQLVYLGTKNGVKAASAASRVFKGNGKGKAERLEPKAANDLFDLNYNEDQSMIRETISQFAVKMRTAAEKTDDQLFIDEELWQEFNELQLAYLQVPESLGGMMKEKSTVTQMLMLETLAYGDLGQALAFFSRHSALNAIIRWGSEAQQQELVPLFLKDEPEFASIATNEPVPLFNPFKLNTTAEKNDESYFLNGKKNMVPLGERCSFFLVAAQSDKGPQVFIVDKTAKGLTITKDRSMGLNAAELCELSLENVKVDQSAMLCGSEGIDYTGFINYGKLGWCALAVGCCQAVLDYVIPYANERVAFGEPISHRQAVAFMISDIKIELDSMRILTQRAAARAEQGLDFQKQVYLAHVLCSDKSMQIGSNGVQLLGGHGYIRDFPVERWYRDLRAVAIGYSGSHL